MSFGSRVMSSSGVHADPGAGVAALVHLVVDQARVAAYRDALAGRLEVGLGGDGVLVVAEVIADVGEDLDEGDAEVGGVALLPVRHDERQAVQDQGAEAGVVLGEVVDLGLVALGWGTNVFASCSRGRWGSLP